MRINHIMAALFFVGLVSCEKMDIKPLAFDVVSDSANYTLKTSGAVATFRFSGKPDNISFFSGEVGRRYMFKDRDTATGTPILRFATAKNAGVQPNSLNLFISSDFSGDTTAINSATWTNISNRATWASAISNTAVPSGAVNLSDYAGKPVYIAFRYNAAAGSIQNKWTITSFSLRNELADGTAYTIDSLPTFSSVNNYGNTSTVPAWVAKTTLSASKWALAAANLTFTGAASAVLATDSVEAWAITGPINLKKVTPDAGVSIQSMSNYLPFYTYTYLKAGNYEPVFVASNANVNKQNSVAKKLAITIQ